jgi:hypothetical protein
VLQNLGRDYTARWMLNATTLEINIVDAFGAAPPAIGFLTISTAPDRGLPVCAWDIFLILMNSIFFLHSNTRHISWKLWYGILQSLWNLRGTASSRSGLPMGAQLVHMHRHHHHLLLEILVNPASKLRLSPLAIQLASIPRTILEILLRYISPLHLDGAFECKELTMI